MARLRRRRQTLASHIIKKGSVNTKLTKCEEIMGFVSFVFFLSFVFPLTCLT